MNFEFSNQENSDRTPLPEISENKTTHAPSEPKENQTSERNGEFDALRLSQRPPEEPPKQKKKRTNLLAAAALTVSLALMISLFGTIAYFTKKTQAISDRYEAKIADLEEKYIASERNTSSEHTQLTTNLNEAVITIDRNSLAISTVVAKVRPSVVCISVTVPPQTVQYGFMQYQTESSASTGSGIIYSADGYIITNQHVIENAQTHSNAYITVLFDDGTQTEAELIAADAQTDLALIKVSDRTDLPAAEFGTSSTLTVGETALAIGNPLGVEYANSVTMGIISGLDRKVSGENGVSTMIQTDAAVNPGNSGGALVNAQGKVIGVVSAKIASTEVEGIGFAIPIDDALQIIESLKNYGYVKDRPATGIAGGTEVTAQLSRRYNLPTGFYITEITKGSAAEEAGLQLYDVILTFDGKEVTTLEQIEELKKNHKVGDKIEVTYSRNRRVSTAVLTLTEDKG